MSIRPRVHGEGTALLVTILAWVLLIVGGSGSLAMLGDSGGADYAATAREFAAVGSAFRFSLASSMFLAALFAFALSLGVAAHLRNQGELIRLQAGALPVPPGASDARPVIAGEPNPATSDGDADGPMVYCAGRCRRQIPVRSAHYFKDRYFCDEDFMREIG